MYKTRINKWRINKRIKTSEIKAMARKRFKRRIEEGKESAFRFRGRDVNSQELNNHLKRKGISEDELMMQPSPPAGTGQKASNSHVVI